MRLVRYGPMGQEKPALLDQRGHLRDLTGSISDLTGVVLSPTSLAVLQALDPGQLPLVPGQPRLGPCVAGVSKIIGVALNYQQHIVETGAKTPTEPNLFLKAPSSLCGANDDIILPPGATKLDWEVELGVVIGTVAKNVTVDQALDHVAGYCLLNDVSERAWQGERGGPNQHTKGKSADTFCPLGPWLVTRDDIIDVQALRLWTDVNGTRMQDCQTREMITPVAGLVAYISTFMTLLPGDIIATGTPDGVGKGRTPPVYLKVGDEVIMGIDGLGQQRHLVVAA
jgi:2-keto-4-pentenoate hydratase/2-oxohepta-3-ene-1,7-dioic acid hydratase in catechol pathway